MLDNRLCNRICMGMIHCPWFNSRDIFMIICRSILLRMRNVADKCCTENQNTHFVFSNFFFSKNPAFYEIMWKNTVQRGSPQMTIWRMRIACWITTARDANSEYVILNALSLPDGYANAPQYYVIVHCLFFGSHS